MSWIKDGAYDHKGWVANVLADGRVGTSTTSGGVIVHELTGDDIVASREVRRYEGTNHVDIVIPWDQVALWRVTCQCGWTGSEQPALTDMKYGARECPEAVADSWAVPEWHAHVAPFAALSKLEHLVNQQRDLDARVIDTVRLARVAGASWTQVGRAAGLSKQGAQQRWS